MSDHLTNFRAWYADVLDCLYQKRPAGLAVLMISMPLLERYLRQKNGLAPEQPLDDRCMDTLRGVFSALPDTATAWNFWHVYRNGFLHQATLSLRTAKGRSLPAASLTHDIAVPVIVQADGSFVLNPVRFSEQVVQRIESEFAVFAGVGTAGPPLPQVIAIVGSSTGIDPPPIELSTRSR